MRSRSLATLLALVGATTAASAQPLDTQLRYDVRLFHPDHNNGWAQSISAFPGDRIEVRAVITYTGSAPVYALGQIVFQPVISGWSLADTIIGTPGTPDDLGIGPIGSNTSTPPGYVEDLPGVYGRIAPFAGATTTTSSFYRGHMHENPDGTGRTYLRIARNDITNWIGVGPSSGSGASNNRSGIGGVNASQAVALPHPPPPGPVPNLALANLIVFKFGFTLSAATPARDLTVFTPPPGIGRSTAASSYGEPDTRWYNSVEDPSPGAHRSDVQVLDGLIHVLPAPSSFATLTACTLLAAAGRRATRDFGGSLPVFRRRR